MSTIETARQPVVEYIKAMLGDGMVDVELDPIHYNTAIDKSFSKYRQRSSNAVEESFAFLTMEQDVNEYTLSQDVIEVRDVFRRSIGSRTGGGDGGSLFEPFNLAYTNTYLMSASNMGGLATYYAFASYQKLVGKMFGSYIQFAWNPSTKKLTIMQRPRGEETVLLWLYNYKPDFVLLNDPYAGTWLKDYALAQSKIILGQARGKYGQYASPQGGVTLNGDALIQQGKEEIEKLELELTNYTEGGKPMWFVVG
jgi:hypothetical protein